MAKTKTKKKTVRRRRRVGAMGGKTDFMQLLMVVAGGVGANIVKKMVPDDMGGTDLTKYKAAAPVLLGIGLPMFIKAPWAKSVGLGLVAGGGAALLKDAGIIGALGGDEAPMISAYERGAYLEGRSAPMLSGTNGVYCG